MIQGLMYKYSNSLSRSEVSTKNAIVFFHQETDSFGLNQIVIGTPVFAAVALLAFTNTNTNTSTSTNAPGLRRLSDISSIVEQMVLPLTK